MRNKHTQPGHPEAAKIPGSALVLPSPVIPSEAAFQAERGISPFSGHARKPNCTTTDFARCRYLTVVVVSKGRGFKPRRKTYQMDCGFTAC
jgi:hypothetical protein